MPNVAIEPPGGPATVPVTRAVRPVDSAASVPPPVPPPQQSTIAVC